MIDYLMRLHGLQKPTTYVFVNRRKDGLKAQFTPVSKMDQKTFYRLALLAEMTLLGTADDKNTFVVMRPTTPEMIYALETAFPSIHADEGSLFSPLIRFSNPAEAVHFKLMWEPL